MPYHGHNGCKTKKKNLWKPSNPHGGRLDVFIKHIDVKPMLMMLMTSLQNNLSSLHFYIHYVRARHGLDVPKQIILSDHCFGFKLVHNFHRPDALPGVKPPFRPWGIALLHGSSSSGFG